VLCKGSKSKRLREREEEKEEEDNSGLKERYGNKDAVLT